MEFLNSNRIPILLLQTTIEIIRKSINKMTRCSRRGKVPYQDSQMPPQVIQPLCQPARKLDNLIDKKLIILLSFNESKLSYINCWTMSCIFHSYFSSQS